MATLDRNATNLIVKRSVTRSVCFGCARCLLGEPGAGVSSLIEYASITKSKDRNEEADRTAFDEAAGVLGDTRSDTLSDIFTDALSGSLVTLKTFQEKPEKRPSSVSSSSKELHETM